MTNRIPRVDIKHSLKSSHLNLAAQNTHDAFSRCLNCRPVMTEMLMEDTEVFVEEAIEY